MKHDVPVGFYSCESSHQTGAISWLDVELITDDTMSRKELCSVQRSSSGRWRLQHPVRTLCCCLLCLHVFTGAALRSALRSYAQTSPCSFRLLLFFPHEAKQLFIQEQTQTRRFQTWTETKIRTKRSETVLQKTTGSGSSQTIKLCRELHILFLWSRS